MEKEKLSVRVELDKNHISMLEELKKTQMLKTNADVLRYALFDSTRSHSFSIDEDKSKQIKELISRPTVRSKYLIYSIDDFIKSALNNHIEHIRSNLKSILDWDVRSNLSDEELKIAVAFIECQRESNTDQVRLSDLVKKMESRNEGRIRQILDKFVNQGILDAQVVDEEKVYHAWTS